MFHNKFFFLVFFLIFNFCPVETYSKELKCPEYIKKEFKRYKNYRQLMGIAKKESGFRSNARNGSCLGIMQVNYKIWTKELINKKIIKSHRDLRNVKYNIKAGAYIIAFYKNDYNRYRGIKPKKEKTKQ